MLIRKTGKRETTKGIKLPDEESLRTLGEKENYKHLEMLKGDTIKRPEMKEKVSKSKSNVGDLSRG